MRVKQPDLFPAPPRPASVVRKVIPGVWEFFDFERDGDAARCVPNPGTVIPDWLLLPTDDPEWVPVTRFG